MLLLAFDPNQGPFPPPALAGFNGTMSPSDICLGRRWPSRVRRCLAAPTQTSLVASGIDLVRAVTTTPAGSSDASLVSSPTTTAFPVIVAGRLPHRHFRGLLGVHCTLRPARSADFLNEAVSESASVHLSPPGPPPVLPAGTSITGRDFHPRIPDTLTRRTQQRRRAHQQADRPGPGQLAVRRQPAWRSGRGPTTQPGGDLPAAAHGLVRLPA